MFKNVLEGQTTEENTEEDSKIYCWWGGSRYNIRKLFYIQVLYKALLRGHYKAQIQYI